MPEKKTVQRARQDARAGKAPTSQAGEFVREEMHHIREGKHGARSTRQAIAIGLSKARRAGVALPPPAKGRTSERTRRSAERAYRQGRAGKKARPSSRRSKAATGALRREGHSAASTSALSRQARQSAGRRSAPDRSQAARQAVKTKGSRGRSNAAKKAARRRARKG